VAFKTSRLESQKGSWELINLMNAQEAQTLQLHEIVVWTPDGTKGEVTVIDGSGVQVRWEDDQCGYYQFTDLLSQIERLP
jgi:hypothetical protein